MPSGIFVFASIILGDFENSPPNSNVAAQRTVKYPSIVSVDQIKTAIEQLSLEQRAELAAWFHGWEDDEWDEQMKRDLAAGKLDHVLREVDEDIRAEQLREMP